MSRRLTVRASHDGRVVMVLEQRGDTIHLVESSENMRPDAERFVLLGFSELVGEPGKRRSETIPPTHPEFLLRLAAMLRRMQMVVDLDSGRAS